MPFITQGKVNWKYILIVAILASIVGVGSLSCLQYFYKPLQPYNPPIVPPKVFSTKGGCEEKTECEECVFITCDVIPPGETLEEVCGKDFKAGWQCIKSTDETTDWKIYSDPKAVFTFKYPTDWEIKTDYQYKSASCRVNPNCEGIHYIFLNKISDSRPPNLGEIEKFGIGINMPQCAGVKMDSLPGNNWICVFDNNSEILDIYEKIKNSFQLIKDETADWKTYRNEEYGFEMKYPEEWVTREEKEDATGSNYKKRYVLYIFHPENITEVDIYGEVHVVIFSDVTDKFIEEQLALLKKDPFLTSVEEVTINGMEGFKGTALYQEEDGTTFILDEILKNKEKLSVYRIVGMGHDSERSNYQEKTSLIISTFKFIDEFCGTSTYGSCISDSDCIAGGCSGQLCQSKNDELLGTTCEWKECYRAKDYGFECKCVNSKCQWAK